MKMLEPGAHIDGFTIGSVSIRPSAITLQSSLKRGRQSRNHVSTKSGEDQISSS